MMSTRYYFTVLFTLATGVSWSQYALDGVCCDPDSYDFTGYFSCFETGQNTEADGIVSDPDCAEFVECKDFVPQIAGLGQSVCPGDSAFVEFVPDGDIISFEGIPEYSWSVVPSVFGGEVIADGGIMAYVTAGVYRFTVQDDSGCRGTRTFSIQGVDPSMPDLSIDALCSGENEVHFDGGYAAQEGGYLNLELFSSIDGWLGSYLDIDIIHANGSITNTALTLPTGTYTSVQDHPELALIYGDTVVVTYVSNNPDNDQYFSLNMSVCTENCLVNSDGCFSFNNLTSGILLYGPALCFSQPLPGTWVESSGLGSNSFSVVDEFNTTWSASDFGLYELCFTEDICGTTSCYDVEVNLPPTIELSGNSIVWVCGDDELDLEVLITDPADVATINWPYPGDDNVLFNEYSFSQYTATTLVVTVENGCGEASDQVEVIAMPEPVLENVYSCGGGATILLDPIQGDQNSELVYQWTFNGNDAEIDDNEWEISATGSYCVTVPNDGCPGSFDDSDCAFVQFVNPIDVEAFLGGTLCEFSTDSLDGIEVLLSLNPDFYYPEYIVTWPDGTSGAASINDTWAIPQGVYDFSDSVQFCVTVQDPYGCESLQSCGWITSEGCCNDPLACNYVPSGTDAAGCLYADECGVCGGQGIPVGCCNCFCDSLDAIGICGGGCLFDGDGNGICDDAEVYGCTYSTALNFEPEASRDDGSCVFNMCGEGTIWDPATQLCIIDESACGWQPDSNDDGLVGVGDLLDFLVVYGDVDVDQDGVWDSGDLCVDTSACNYAQNPSLDCAYLDILGVCGGGCEADEDADGVCDDVDTCVGELDECGVCNGPGPTEIVIESITILYDSVYLPQLDEWYVYEFGADTTFSYTCAPFFGDCGDPVSYQGYDYATVLIGEQCWFAENLRSENYDNGDAIPAGLSDSEWSYTTLGATAVYGEDAGCDDYSPDIDACDPAQSLNEYGRLYNWYAVVDVRGLCPSGWHVPTDGEWTVMTDFLGGSSVAGGQMKTTYGWYGGGNGTNSSGFSGLPGGIRGYLANFVVAGYFGYWWSSSPLGSNAWARSLSGSNEIVVRGENGRQSGFSVRCVRDAE